MNRPSISSSVPPGPSNGTDNIRPKILIADDETFIRQALVDGLRLELGPDVELVEAEDGSVAVDKIVSAQADQFHTVITDLKMPRKNGIYVVQQAITSRVSHVLLFTTHDLRGLEDMFGQQVMREFEAQGLKYLPKPFRSHELRKIVVEPFLRRFPQRNSQN